MKMDKNLEDESIIVVRNGPPSLPVTTSGNEKKATETIELMQIEAEIHDRNNEKYLGWKRYLGLVYTLLSANFSSLSAIMLKLIGHVDPLNLNIFAYPTAAIIGTILIWYTVTIERKSVATNVLPLGKHKKAHGLIWLVALFNFLTIFVHIFAFKFITVADTRTIIMASVITVYIFGWLCLGEKCGVVPIITAIVALCGIGVITRPPVLTGAEEFNMDTLIGVSLACSCMIFSTMIILMLRYLQNVHYTVVNTGFYAWGFLFTFPFAFGLGKVEIPENISDLIGMMGVGAIWQLGVTFLVLALQVEEAGVVALIRTSEVVFNFFWQMVILKVYPDLISVIGAALVVTGVIVITLRKWVAALNKERRLRKSLVFLLL